MRTESYFSRQTLQYLGEREVEYRKQLRRRCTSFMSPTGIRQPRRAGPALSDPSTRRKTGLILAPRPFSRFQSVAVRPAQPPRLRRRTRLWSNRAKVSCYSTTKAYAHSSGQFLAALLSPNLTSHSSPTGGGATRSRRFGLTSQQLSETSPQSVPSRAVVAAFRSSGSAWISAVYFHAAMTGSSAAMFPRVRRGPEV